MPQQESQQKSSACVLSQSGLHEQSVHEQVTIFNQTLINIFSNYIPNKLITVDDKDPPWMNESIKKNIMAKMNAC